MSKNQGILITVFSAFIFGFIPFFAKTAYANGFNPFTFSLYRSLFACIEIFIFIKIKNIDYKITKKQTKILFKLSLFGYSLLLILLFMSYNYLATGLAMTLHFIYPVVVMIASIVIYNEKVDWRKIVSLVIAFLGIYFLVGFGSFENISIIGVTLALVSGFLYAYFILVVAGEDMKVVNPFVIVFYISLFNTYIIVAESLLIGKLNLSYNYMGLISVIAGATLSNFIGMVALQIGLKVINPSTATILSTLEPITSMLVGVIVLNEILCWYHIVGTIFIIISVIIVALVEKNVVNKGKRAI